MIFIHGWPGLGLTWRPQLLAFAALGFRVAAMDTLGYGGSAAPGEDEEYSCEELVRDQLEFLDVLGGPSGKKEAVWVAHDWGCGILWTLAAHFPEKCVGVVNLCVPYRMLELGLETLKTTINRDIYPEGEYENGPWDYQVYYEEMKHEGATKQLDGMVEKSVKMLYAKGNPASRGKPARTASVKKDGGWFGWKKNEVMDLPLGYTVFEGEEDVFEAVVEGLKRNGFHGATSYYLNHKMNGEYNREESCPTRGRLDMPVLFVDALFDGVCTEAGAKGSYDPMRKLCKDLKEVEVEAGHWVNMEKPREVNAAMAKWLVERVGGWWPKEQEKGKGGKGGKL